ncbi:class I SAM-dependent methyltransferase [Tabrizicola aquatica]|uniref:class I SAM-dependent methyltransferase n=1 Tax=Tabrizicola aquatica TaxID=909926 RepID=UPI001FE856D3|nr:class I SAM-dependent methyltransferase [Tabrizicola aquatica]
MFKRALGPRYYAFLTALHRTLLFDWYLEIGCRTGESVALSRSKTVAVDPFFRAELNIIGVKPALHVFQQTSDDFFASGFLAKNDIRLAVSFLDGMHLFEFLLRDFMQTEAASHPQGVVMLHDCAPFTHEMTTRDLTAIRGSWTGDVWKLVPILQKWRPELKLTMLDSRPTGLLCVTNLQPGNRVLQDNYARILAEYMDLDLAGFGVERFFGLFDYVSSREEVERGFPLFRSLALDPSQALEPKLHST